MTEPVGTFRIDIAAIAWRTIAGGSADQCENDPLNEREISIFASVKAIAEIHPDRIALVDESETVTFAALFRKATALGQRIAASPPGPIGILLPQGPTLAVAVLGSIAAGRLALLLNPETPPARLAGILASGAASLVIATADDSRALSCLPESVRRIYPTAANDSTAAMDTLPPPPDPSAPAVVVFTSGTTGPPKGIVRSARRLLDHARREQESGKCVPGDIVLSLADPYTGSGLSNLMAGLVLGLTQVVASLGRLGATRLVRLAGRMRVTLLTGAPSLLCLLLQRQAAGEAFAALDRVVVKGDAMLAAELAIIRDLVPARSEIRFGYGLTETSAITGWCIPPGYHCTGARVPAGTFLAEVRYALLGEAGSPTPEGEAGELWISSVALMSGEWRDGRLVRDRLAVDPNDPSRRVFRTGDIVRIDGAGLLHVLGRSDRQVKINGVRIDPAEAENVLRGAPGVADAAVLPETHAAGQRLAGYVVPTQEMDLTDGPACAALIAGLRDRLGAALPAALHPGRIALVDHLPRIGTGKIDTAALARPTEPAPAS